MDRWVMEGIGSGGSFATDNQGELLERGLQLAEKWGNFPAKKLSESKQGIRGFDKMERVDFMQGLEDPWKKSLTAYMLENAYKYYSRMDETTRSIAVGNYEKYVFPIIRMTYANLVASDLVSVQPLPGPTGLIFYMDAIAGSTKGSITKGTHLFDAQSGPEQSYHYTDEVIENEQVGTGTGGTANFTGNLGYTPLRPGTFSITNGDHVVTDDGNGNLIGDTAGGTNTINYATGAFDVTFAGTPGNGDIITTTYEYNSEANDNIPEIEIQLTSTPVVTRPNKLRARWSMEAEQDLLAMHGMTAEAEFVTVMTNRVSQEINQKIIRHLRSIAFNSDNPIVFDTTPPVGVAYKDHREIIIQSFVETSNTIFSATQRVQASWLVLGVNVANIVETLAPYFVKTPSPPGVTGIRKIGTLGDWDVYKDPSYPANEWMMGYKGGTFLDTGYVHAVYQGLLSTPSITLDDFLTRKGLMTRTAQKVINRRFYARGQIVHTTS